MMERHAFAWSHGIATVQSFGGMLGPVLLLLPDGRQVAPLHVPPWFADSEHTADLALLRELRGEWPCVPFGFDAPRTMPEDWRATGESFVGADTLHGYSSHVHWRFLSAGRDGVTMECLYPEDHPIDRLWRRIAPLEGKPALRIELHITARRACSLPIGLHPVFRLPSSGQARLFPPAFESGRVFPRSVEPEGGFLCPNAVFQDLAAIPARDGGKRSLSWLPLEGETEELVQLCGVDGDFVLAYPMEGWQARLSWNRTQFPSLLLWISNRGRSAPPWNSRHVALGVEPVRAAFDLGPAISNAPNPIAAQGVATTCHFNPAQPLITAYRIEVEPLTA